MKRNRRPRPPVQTPSAFVGFRFPPDVILLAVRWYLRYGLSYRDLEEILAERGIEVNHVTLYRWVQQFTPELIDAARPCRRAVGNRWFVDETYVKVSGVWRYVYRAVDQHGQVIDVFVSKHREILIQHDPTTFTSRKTVWLTPYRAQATHQTTAPTPRHREDHKPRPFDAKAKNEKRKTE